MGYTSISHVAFGDSWSATSHNLLIDNAAELFRLAAQYGVPYFATTTTIANAVLANGQIIQGGATVPTAAYPPGIVLTPQASIAPLSGVNAAALQLIESSGAGTAKPVIYELLFDAATDEGRMWTFRCPNVPAAAPILKFSFRMVSATSGNVVFAAQIAAISDADTSVSAKVFASANSATVAVPGAANTQKEATITLTNADSIAKADWVCLILFRDADNGSDTATGDCAVNALEFTYG
jgi:hypothetical protein